MNKKILFLLIALLGVIGYWSYIQQGTNGGGYSLVGKPAPDFSLKDEKGNTIRLNRYRGKVVLLHFWATWCPPCVEEFPSLDKMVKKFDPAKFVLLPLSVDEEGINAIREFRKRVSFGFPVVLDSKADVADLYGTYRLPESFLIDGSGKVVKKISGPQDWEHPRWEGMIQKTIDQRLILSLFTSRSAPPSQKSRRAPAVHAPLRCRDTARPDESPALIFSLRSI